MTMSIQEILAASAGRKPWFDVWQAAIGHLKTHADQIGNLEVGAAPGVFAAYDTRFFVTESAFDANAYTAALSPVATGEALPTGYRIYFLPTNANTGAATLDVGSTDGAIAINKVASGAKADLAAGDLAAGIPALLVYDGTHWVIISDIPPPPVDPAPATTRQVITASGTWTRPDGCRAVDVEVLGGGGGGARSSDNDYTQAAAGGYVRKLIDVTSIASATLVIGAAGDGRTSTTGNGSAGGTSSWSDGTNTLTAGGGGGGLTTATSPTAGTATGGDISIPGETNPVFRYSMGASSMYGSGGDGPSSAPNPATGYGAGGMSGVNVNGSNGAPGIIIVTEYY